MVRVMGSDQILRMSCFADGQEAVPPKCEEERRKPRPQSRAGSLAIRVHEEIAPGGAPTVSSRKEGGTVLASETQATGGGLMGR